MRCPRPASRQNVCATCPCDLLWRPASRHPEGRLRLGLHARTLKAAEGFRGRASLCVSVWRIAVTRVSPGVEDEAQLNPVRCESLDLATYVFSFRAADLPVPRARARAAAARAAAVRLGLYAGHARLRGADRSAGGCGRGVRSDA